MVSQASAMYKAMSNGVPKSPQSRSSAQSAIHSSVSVIFRRLSEDADVQKRPMFSRNAARSSSCNPATCNVRDR
ncbi:hypothetical protein X777_10696 [Ooceraea biroi]|uniref:Uncharacterized protein n=1 Tax=Ooceraea biroi TaxID=2015173 RepID=A0A026W3A3_OOCBI|nr:hypothetical protein X777_10696 [Ooceraea biroi]